MNVPPTEQFTTSTWESAQAGDPVKFVVNNAKRVAMLSLRKMRMSPLLS